ncbi:AB hydrolase-1 domain-containing protein [Plasmodiophora brassicae]|uniref:AB hydrolase-1 domain-containing protein n=1 Tax=Plasmodiophora brassicae TaxID=37360 RepID=A0A0G4J7S1_PLABS|nr:hypothetical protein PBRA_003194 [Plasmodiophora brassicae]SPQ95666.1 unnamed protein product [Plasmodiophora brassicae]
MVQTGEGRYATVNGVQLYYETHGSGRPVVMLHGGFGSFEMLAGIWPAVAEKHLVIGVDLYGHGRTALTDRAFTTENMADDIAALLVHLGIERADIIGYSVGGLVGLLVAIRHPDRVHTLATISSPIRRSAWFPEIREGMAMISADNFIGTPVVDNYNRLAPNKDDFKRFASSMRSAMTREYDWSDKIPALPMPVLFICGDNDSFPPSHACEVFQMRGGGLKDAGWTGEHIVPSELAVLPNTTHYNIVSDRAHLLIPLLTGFLHRHQPSLSTP